jgi:hypothetical protein
MVAAAAVLPSAAVYIQARFSFRYPRRSQLLVPTLLSLAVILGVVPLQYSLLRAVDPPAGEEYMRWLIVVQFAAAVGTYFWTIFSKRRTLSASERTQLDELNNHW